MPENKPLSTGGWSEQIVNVQHATVLPPVQPGFVQACGVLDAEGRYCHHGATWRKHRALTIAPEMPQTVTNTLTGRWLWGGVMRSHFGHFLTESTGRLWALDATEEPIAGIVFTHKRPRGRKLNNFQRRFFDLLGVDVPVRVLRAPTRVERLIVPGQGLGLGEIAAGTQKVRDQFASRFAAQVMPNGSDKLYISRSRLGPELGSILGETCLEKLLAEEGYEIFHPQAHSLEDQIARYRAARHVIAADGSALHLLAMAMPRAQRVAIIARRKSSAVDLLVRHVGSFMGTTPLVIHAIKKEWLRNDTSTRKRFAFGELSFVDLGATLQAAGFVSNGAWTDLPDQAVRDALIERGRMAPDGDVVP